VTIDAEPRLAVPHGSASVHELLQFERLMSELSASFINLPASEIDAVIEGGLRRIVETLDIDRSSLSRLVPGTGQLQTTHSWAVDGLPPVLGKTWPVDDFAYLVALGRTGKPLVFSSLDDLPPAANAARLAYQRFGMRSHVAQPLMVAGELVGFLGFGSLRRERTWPEDLLARMRLLAQIFAAALALKRAQEELDRALGFERLLTELSAGFIDLPAERLDDAIEEALRRIVQTLDIDRSTLALVDPLTGASEFTHSYAVEGVAPVPRITNVQNAAPWVYAEASAGRMVVFSRLDDLPPAASVDKELYRRLGQTSHVTVPLFAADEFLGGLTFGCVRRERSWPDDLLGRFRLLAEIFANAIARKRAQEERDHALGFERLLADLSASMLRAPSLEVERAIPDALRAMGEFLRVDSVALWRQPATDDHFSLMHWWAPAGVPAPPATVYKKDLPWVSDRLLSGEVVRFASPEDPPGDATADKHALRRFGARSLLAVPLYIDGNVAATLSLVGRGAERSWPDALIPRVRLIGEALANLLERDRKARQLAEAQGEAAHFRERLAHLVRVHTVGEMSAALAHEITQPLGAIENYALAARRRASEASPDLAKVVDLLDKVVGQATRAGDVVLRLRGLVKRHELQLIELDVEHAIRTCIEMVKADCELREIRVELKAADRVPRVVADEIHVQQVTLNLLRNAMEAMDCLGSDRTKVITVEVGLPGPDAVMVQVADGGPGIPEGELERVFESFYSTKAEGLGIGLAICRKLVEAHGGALWASHNPGGGAVFQFTLPVRAAGS
jgi:signal transduction histidine kinase